MKHKNPVSYLLFDVLIPNMIWVTLLSLPSAIGGIVYSLNVFMKAVTNAQIEKGHLALAIVCVIICLFCLVFDVIYSITTLVNKPTTPVFPKLETSYKLTESVIEMYFVDRAHLSVRQRNSFVVLKDSLKEIKNIMNWTGMKYVKSTIDQECFNRGYRLVDSNRDRSPHTITISFPEKFVVGDKGSYALETFIEDGIMEDGKCTDFKMVPVLAKVIKCCTDKLTLRLTVPVGPCRKC